MSDWTACYRRKLPAASPLNDLAEAMINANVLAVASLPQALHST